MWSCTWVSRTELAFCKVYANSCICICLLFPAKRGCSFSSFEVLEMQVNIWQLSHGSTRVTFGYKILYYPLTTIKTGLVISAQTTKFTIRRVPQIIIPQYNCCTVWRETLVSIKFGKTTTRWCCQIFNLVIMKLCATMIFNARRKVWVEGYCNHLAIFPSVRYGTVLPYVHVHTFWRIFH